MDEVMVQSIRQLKTQRLLPVVGQSFLISDTTPVYTGQHKEIFTLPSWISRLLGIKDRRVSKAAMPQGSATLSYLLLLFAVIIAGLYTVIIHKLEGNLYQRLYLRYLVNALVLLPVVLVETSRKATREMFNLGDALGPRTLLKNWFNSLFLTLWNICFCLSLKYTEASTTLFYSNLLLLIWVLNKIFRKASGISEWEVNGCVLLFFGVLVFSLKQWLNDINETQTTSLYVSHNIAGVGFAIAASFAAAAFFTTNYDLTYYLPSYTSLLIVTIFNLLNLELINFGLSILYPVQYQFQFLMNSCSFDLFSFEHRIFIAASPHLELSRGFCHGFRDFRTTALAHKASRPSDGRPGVPGRAPIRTDPGNILRSARARVHFCSDVRSAASVAEHAHSSRYQTIRG